MSSVVSLKPNQLAQHGPRDGTTWFLWTFQQFLVMDKTL